jgi:hypothetical protein
VASSCFAKVLQRTCNEELGAISRQQTHHDSIPPVSPLIAAQECQPIETFGQDDILAIPQLVCKLNLVRRERTPTVDLAGCVVLEREDEGDALVQKGT